MELVPSRYRKHTARKPVCALGFLLAPFFPISPHSHLQGRHGITHIQRMSPYLTVSGVSNMARQERHLPPNLMTWAQFLVLKTGRREPTPESCPLTSTRVLGHAYTYKHNKINTIKVTSGNAITDMLKDKLYSSPKYLSVEWRWQPGLTIKVWLLSLPNTPIHSSVYNNLLSSVTLVRKTGARLCKEVTLRDYFLQPPVIPRVFSYSKPYTTYGALPPHRLCWLSKVSVSSKV